MDHRINPANSHLSLNQGVPLETPASGKRKRQTAANVSASAPHASKIIKQRKTTRNIRTKALDQRLKWLTNNAHHTNVILPLGRVNDARHLFQTTLETNGQSVLYIHNPDALDDLKSCVEVDQGQLKLVDGPFNKLLNSGGTLMLNVANFSPQQLEAFNTLMEEKKWEGKPLKNPVRILCLCDTETLKKNLLSGAQISRTSFQNMGDYAFEKYDHLPIEEPQDTYPKGTQFIDLQHDPMWSRTLLGGPSMNADQQWEKTPSAFSDAQHLYVLRNVPEDPYLMDELLKRKADNWNIRLEAGLPEQDIARLIANKGRASNIRELVKQADAAVCILNASNFEEVLAPHFGVSKDPSHQGKLVQYTSLLEQTQKQHSTRISVLVTDDLPEHLWDRMMQHPAEFDIAVAPGFSAPNRYADKLVAIEAPENTSKSDSNADKEIDNVSKGESVDTQLQVNTLFNQPVSFMRCIDPTLFVRSQLSDAASQPPTLLYVTPAMHGDALLYTLERKNSVGASTNARSTSSSFSIKTHQLVNDLKGGKKIILQGLENNPRLCQELATLLHPPHYLYINGQRLHFGEGGGLTGQLVVVTTSTELVKHHALSPTYNDPVKKSDWKEAVCIALHQQFPYQHLDSIKTQVDRLLNLHRILNEEGLIARQDLPMHFSRLEMLYRQFNAADSIGENFSDVLARTSLLSDQMMLDLVGREFLNETFGHLVPLPPDPKLLPMTRAVLKDLLIGDYRPAEKTDDTRYDYLKICLRVLFPEKMNLIPTKSVDVSRLQNLLDKVNHPKDIEQHGWRFLNTFSLDVIQTIVGNEISTITHKNAKDEILKKTLALTLDQAKKQKLRIHPALNYAYQQLSEVSPIPFQLNAYQRAPKLSPAQRNLGKAELVLNQGNAVFLKGPPGAGKTHQVKQLTIGSSHTINIADEGTQEFDQILAAWARSTGPATLVIDEANLAAPENLAMLKSVFADRTLYVDGKVHHLTASHRILFTGNADNMSGRTVQEVAKDSIPTLQHKTLKGRYLRQIFIDPVFDKAFGSQKIPIKEYCASNILSIHDHLQAAFPECEFSPRDLEEFTSQILCFINKYKADGMMLKRLPLWLGVLALNVYANDVSTEDKEVIGAWLKHHLSLSGQGAFPALPHNIDLSQTTLADTPSTRELANKISWWLSTQDIRPAFNPKNTTLGQQALLIEGPASRGKDTVVEAVLRAEKRPYVHINANPNNLDHLRKTLKDACALGDIVLISELNLLPSGVLEGELNALLTGHSNFYMHPGFALIATVNPGDYAGRNRLSAALKNRMQKITINEYQPEELAQIAHHIAHALSNKKIDKNIDATIPADKVDELVKLHHGLNERLQNQASEFRPGIRQLRKALEQIQIQSHAKVSAIFETTYAYYQAQANALSEDDFPKTNVPTKAQQNLEKQKQLQRALSLAQPDWFAQPKILPGEVGHAIQPDGQAFLLRYNYDDHAIYFDDKQNASTLCQALLRGVTKGLPPPNLTASAVLNKAHNVSTERTAMPRVGRSGVGQVKQTGSLGKILGITSKLYLPKVRTNLNDEMLPIFGRPLEFPNYLAQQTVQMSGPMVELADVLTVSTSQGVKIAYLMVPDATLPTNIQLDGQTPQNVFRDQNGGWFCESGSNQSTIKTLRYQLSAYPALAAPLGGQATFFGLDISRNAELSNTIQSIRQRNYPTKNIVAELEKFFKEAFTYSDNDAAALNATKNMTERSQRFIEHRHGVCYEFAGAFAAVLEQEFKIPARLCGGRVTNKTDIPIEGHRWVEYCDAQGRWHKVDPTAASTTLASPGRDNKIFPFVSFADDHYISFTTNVPEKFSLNELGLCNWQIQRQAVTYNAFHGKLNLKRLLRGDTTIYQDAGLRSAAQTKSIYITNFPPQEDQEAWMQFQNRTITPLTALIMRGVKLYALCDNNLGNKVWEEVEDIAAMFHNANRADEASTRELNAVDNLILSADSGDFWNHLTSHYYESLFLSELVDVDNDDAVRECIFSTINNQNHTDLFPLQITAHNKKWHFTADDFEEYLIKYIDRAKNIPDNDEEIVDMLQMFSSHWQKSFKGGLQNKIKHLIATRAHTLNSMSDLIPIMFGEDRMQASLNDFRDISVPLLMTLIQSWLSAPNNKNKSLGSKKISDLLARLTDYVWSEGGFRRNLMEESTAIFVLDRSKPDSLDIRPRELPIETLLAIERHEQTDAELFAEFKEKLLRAMTPRARSDFLKAWDLCVNEVDDQESEASSISGTAA